MKFILIFLFLLLSSITASAEVTLPAMGEGALFSLKKEREIGEKYYQKLQKSPYLVKDELVNFYLNEIMRSLLQGLDRQYRDYHLSLIQNDVVNAFAVPGGYIGIYTGLVFLAENESQLAGVLAHEISHVALRHGMQLQQKSEDINTLAVASLFLALLVNSQTSGQNSTELTEALIYGGVAGSSQSMINFTRENEYEADRKALSLMESANYPKMGIAELFAQIEGDAGKGELQSIEFLRTHPITANRMGEAYQILQKNSIKKIKLSKDYDYFKVYLNYLLKSNYWLTQATQEVLNYQKALKLLKENQIDESQKILTGLYQQDKSNLWMMNVLLDIAEKNNTWETALGYINESLSYYPSHGFLWKKKIDILIKVGQLNDALELSNKYRAALSKIDYYRLMQNIYQQLGDELRSKEMEAEYLKASGYYERALYIFQYLKSKMTDAFKLSLIEEKIRNLKLKIDMEKSK